MVRFSTGVGARSSDPPDECLGRTGSILLLSPLPHGRSRGGVSVTSPPPVGPRGRRGSIRDGELATWPWIGCRGARGLDVAMDTTAMVTHAVARTRGVRRSRGGREREEVGGRAIFLLLPAGIKSYPAMLAPIPGLGGATPLEIACLLAFTAAQLVVIMSGMEGIRKLEKYSAPVLVAFTSVLLAWAYVSAGGFGRILSLPPRLTGAEFWKVFFPALTANISFWSTVAINIPDFARYARSQADQVLGQAGLPVFMGMFTFAGLAITSATETIFGHIVSDPIDLLGRIGGPATKLVAIFGITLAIITTNVAANVVAPANTLVALAPRTFTFASGALVTALLGIMFQPWRLLGSSESFVFTWLLGNAALVGPIGGVVLADHYLVRRTALDVGALYSEEAGSPYYYQGGFNVAAMVAMAAGFSAVVPGFLHKVGVLPSISRALVVAYENAWFVSFFVAGAVYCLLCCRRGAEVKQQYGT